MNKGNANNVNNDGATSDAPRENWIQRDTVEMLIDAFVVLLKQEMEVTFDRAKARLFARLDPGAVERRAP